MSRIDDLMAELAPVGVVYKRIGDIAQVGTGSSDRKDAEPDGKFPFYVRSKEVMRIDAFEFDEEAILIPGEGGIGDIFHFVSGKYALHQRAYRISFRVSGVDAKFAYYYFAVHFKKFILRRAVSATVTSIRKPMITDFRIPVPPLEVQHEIVGILDQFTQLETELEAELEARRQQYAFYRDELLTFSEAGDVRWLPMAEVADFKRGSAMTIRSAIPGAYRLVANSSEPIGTHNESNRDGEFLVVARSGAGAGTVSLWDGPLFLTDAFSIHPDRSVVATRYVYYLLQNQQSALREMKAGGGVPHVRVKEVEAYRIPVPSLAEQKRIVAILDEFEALTNDLSVGLPAELAARRKQYEYYRDRLLAFEEAV